MRRHGCRYDSAHVLSCGRSHCHSTVCSMCWQAERDREAQAVAAAQAELAAQVLVNIVACAAASCGSALCGGMSKPISCAAQRSVSGSAGARRLKGRVMWTCGAYRLCE